jgi:hypothetical protein
METEGESIKKEYYLLRISLFIYKMHKKVLVSYPTKKISWWNSFLDKRI